MKESLIHLKGVKEPIEVTYEQAKKITDIFFDDKVDRGFVISVGDNSFRKSEIRYIRKTKDKPSGGRTHWIIVNYKRGSIWKDVFLSYESAKEEFDLQVSQLHPNQKHNFVIEKRSPDDIPDSYTKSLEGVAKAVEKDKDFSDFDEVTQHALNNF